MLGLVGVYFFVVGGLRFLKLRGIEAARTRQSKVHLVEIVGCTFSGLLALVNTVGAWIIGQSAPGYKVVSDLMLAGAWFLCLAVILMEFQRGLKHQWEVISFWVLVFIAQSFDIQVLARNTDSVTSSFEFGVTITEFVVATILGLSALACNTIPDGANAELESSHGTGLSLGEQTGDSNDGSILAPEDPDQDQYIHRSVAMTQSPEERANIFSQLTFSWLNPLLAIGVTRALEEKDLYPLGKEDHTTRIGDTLEKNWSTQALLPTPSFLKALWHSFGATFAFAGTLKLAQDLLIFVGPWLLQKLILFVKNKDEPIQNGIIYAIAMCVASLVQSTALHQYFLRVYRVGMHIRASIVSVVYRKSFRMSFAARQKYTVGEIVNLQSIDAGRLEGNMAYLHMIWSAPLQIIISLVMLWQVVGWSVLAGLGVMVLLIPINLRISKVLVEIQKTMMKHKDARGKLMNEVMQGIRVIKYFAWEESFLDKIKLIRTDEVATLKKGSYIRAGTAFIWTGTPLLVSIATFATFTLSGNDLTAETAFTALALFNILRFPINMLPTVITGLVESKVAITRLETFLASAELDPEAVRHDSNQASAIKVDNADFAWQKSEDDTDCPNALGNVSFDIKHGELIGIIGPVGSGKSTLLQALLGEIPKRKGVVTVDGTIAYCPQQAWIQNATLKDNVLFGLPLDMQKYQRAVQVCQLTPDIAMLPSGDSTEIGEKGINLSGGQKQRCSLARAVYQNSDIYLLDDPLSAVDAHVGKAIFEQCITGALKDKTRVLVTHQLQYLPYCDRVIVVRAGGISEIGTYAELMQTGFAFAELMNQHVNSHGHDEADEPQEAPSTAQVAPGVPTIPLSPSVALRDSSVTPTAKDAGPLISTPPITHNGKDKKKKNDDGKLILAEQRDTGSVKGSVYMAYVNAIGGIIVALAVVGGYALESGAKMYSDWWLSHWSAAVSEGANTATGWYLGVYSAAGIVNCLFVLLRSFLVVWGGLKASMTLHNKMLGSVFRAPTSFFDTTPIGRILNVFSKDQYAIDESLPRTVSSSFSTLFAVFSVIIVISGVTPWFLVAALPLAFLYREIQQHYLHSSRELQRLNSVSRSPIYALFSETLSGLSTIRAYSKQQHFTLENERKVDNNQKAYFLSTTANRWLGLRLEFVGNSVVFGAAFFTVMGRDTLAAGLAGLSITYALQLTSQLNWLVRMSTDVENELVSVERVNQYSSLPSEAAPVLDTPPLGWPAAGDIKLENLSIRYRPSLPLVLTDINIHIKSREKIGIVGRTGSGKSSLMVALFRLVEPENGRIIIDGLDAHQLGLKDLRSRLAIIPQDPTLFTGTIRSNLDPFYQHTDVDIWDAIDACNLRVQIEGMREGIDSPVSEYGENLSVGTRQLMCLARAVLRKPRVLVLDEATANCDFETDEFIQRTIRDKFKDATVLTIAHRIGTIMDSDRVLVLDAGEVAEFDTPEALIKNPSSKFYSLASKAKATLRSNS